MNNFEILLAQKKYVVESVDQFLADSRCQFEEHLECVAKRYVESIRLECRRLIERATREASRKYPLPGGESATRTQSE